jgi:hypothetical protein
MMKAMSIVSYHKHDLNDLIVGKLFEIQMRGIVNFHTCITVIVTLNGCPWPWNTECVMAFAATLRNVCSCFRFFLVNEQEPVYR